MSSSSPDATAFERIKNSRQWKFGVRLFRATRIVGLGFVIYNAGVTQGTIDYARDPQKMQASLVEQVVATHTKRDSDGLVPHHDSRSLRVQGIAQRIISAAQQTCLKKQHESDINIKNAAARIGAVSKRENVTAIGEDDKSTTDNKETQKLSLKDQVKFENDAKLIWKIREERMNGNWTILLLNNPVPNAFVHGLTPRHIYVNTGLLSTLNASDEEIAFIIAHEISHEMYGHCEERNSSNWVTAMAMLVVMAFVDPSGGFVLAFDWVLDKAREAFLAAFSRENEDEADALGIEIVSEACYDLHKAVNVMHKIADAEHHHKAGWNSSHPSSDDRAARLNGFAKQFAASHVARCSDTRNWFWQSVWGFKKQQQEQRHRHRHHHHNHEHQQQKLSSAKKSSGPENTKAI